MIKKILNIFLFTFLMFSITISEEELDYYEVNDSFYKISKYNYDYDKELITFQNEYFLLLFSVMKGTKNWNELEKYILKIDNYSLIGTNVRDSFLSYLRGKFTEPLIDLLKSYKKNNNNIENIDIINEIILKKENAKNYRYTTFCYSALLNRKELDYDISLLLPSSKWEEIKLGKSSMINYMSGDNNYSGLITIYKEKIKKNYNILEDKTISQKIFNFKGQPITLKKNMYFIKCGKIKEIATNYQIGNIKFNKIFEQITCSSEKYNYQVIVERRRFYLTDNTLYFVSLNSTIAGDHILADQDKLIIVKGLLLDSIKFD